MISGVIEMKSPKLLQKIKEKIGGKISAKLSKLSYRQFFFIIAVVCSIVFLVLLFVLPDGKSTQTAKQKQQQAKPKVETVKVITANRDIPPRTILREDMLTTTEIPSNLLPEGYVTDSKQAINLPAAVAIQKGDVLTTKKFYADIRMAGFPGKIPDDCRAVSIAISDVTGVAGFAKPGDYVDIMSVSGKRSSKSTTGNIILQNLLLLGINKSAKVEQPNTTQASSNKDGKKETSTENSTQEGGSDDKDKKDKKKETEPGSTASAQAMATATLAVSPADALKLAVASQTGTLYLALRPVIPKETIVLDTEYVLDSGEDEEDSSGRSYADPARAPTATPAASVPLPSTSEVPAQVPQVSAPPLPGSGNEVVVEVIRGTQSTTVRSE